MRAQLSGPVRSLLLVSTCLAVVAGAACASTSESPGIGSGASGGGGPTGGSGGAGGACEPGKEICDGKDNDCDGQVDEAADLPDGCACSEGDSQECYTGMPADTAGVGTCKKGTQGCDGGQWGACTGEVVPADETCNGKDDDCNGEADDLPDIGCGVGQCQVTVPACTNGQDTTCTPGQPALEICDGLDNDCDQQTDESFPNQGAACDTGNPGVCGPGSLACVNGAEVCQGANMGGQEQCNGTDDDCNGIVDDNVPGTGGACSTGYPGVCGPGVVACIGALIDCYSVVSASPEICDGLDNDCDGATDQGDPGGGAACDTGDPGICGPGVLHCVNGAVQCVANQLGASEICNGLDDDCDGAPDDGNPGGGIACATGVPGICATGVTNCTNGAIVCDQTVLPQAESCNGIDDDCDGAVDDGNPGGGAACNTGLLGVCAAGTVTCVGGQLQCLQNVQPSPEICGNAIDENCDGNAPGAPTVYFDETFANNSKGWTLGTDWAIGSAVASVCASATTGNDPGVDHTATADNGVAGVILGGCYPTTLHGDYCITSPNINLSVAPGSVYLNYWRHLHTDYPSYITSKVDVSANGGASWTTVYSVPSGQFQNDASWAKAAFNVTAQKSATFRVRFCYAAGSGGIITGGGWNVDDVQLTDTTCN